MRYRVIDSRQLRALQTAGIPQIAPGFPLFTANDAVDVIAAAGDAIWLSIRASWGRPDLDFAQIAAARAAARSGVSA